MNTMHLNEEQIDDVLIGDAGTDVAAHLDACGECRERVAMASAPMESFAAVTLAWSERQSATMGVQAIKAGSAAWPHRLSWTLAAVVLIAVGLLLPMTAHDGRSGDKLAAKDAAPVATASAAETQESVRPVTEPMMEQRAKIRTVAAERTSSAEVARDNRMLAAIHDELDASVQSPADAFGLGAAVGRAGGGHGQNAPAPSLD
jgi:hypothetical protein